MSNASSDLKKSLPWNPWLGIGSAVSIFFIAQVVAIIPVSIIYSLSGNSVSSQGGLSSTIGFQFLEILVVEALVVGLIYLFLRFYKN